MVHHMVQREREGERLSGGEWESQKNKEREKERSKDGERHDLGVSFEAEYLVKYQKNVG